MRTVAVLLWMTHTSSKFCTMVSALMQMTIDGIRVVLINEPKNFGQSDKYNRVNYWKFPSFWFGDASNTHRAFRLKSFCVWYEFIIERCQAAASEWKWNEHETNEWERERAEKMIHARKSVSVARTTGRRQRSGNEGLLPPTIQFNKSHIHIRNGYNIVKWLLSVSFAYGWRKRCAFTVNKM